MEVTRVVRFPSKMFSERSCRSKQLPVLKTTISLFAISLFMLKWYLTKLCNRQKKQLDKSLALMLRFPYLLLEILQGVQLNANRRSWLTETNTHLQPASYSGPNTVWHLTDPNLHFQAEHRSISWISAKTVIQLIGCRSYNKNYNYNSFTSQERLLSERTAKIWFDVHNKRESFVIRSDHVWVGEDDSV